MRISKYAAPPATGISSATFSKAQGMTLQVTPQLPAVGELDSPRVAPPPASTDALGCA